MKKKPANIDKARKAASHSLYLAALQQGQRPLRAATFTDKRKEASRNACRNKKTWN